MTIRETGAERVIVTHGYEAVMVRWLTEQGLEASAFETEYGDNDDEDPHASPLPQAGEGERVELPRPLAGEGGGEGRS